MPRPWLDTATARALSDADTVRAGIGRSVCPRGAAFVKEAVHQTIDFRFALYFGSIAFSLEAMPRVAVNGKGSLAGFPFAIFATPPSG